MWLKNLLKMFLTSKKIYKLLTVVGARPQFIKAAPLSKAIAEHPFLEEIMVHSGQHYDNNLSNIFFEELGLPTPKYLMEVGSSSPATQFAHIILKLDSILQIEKPDMVIVFGDTNTTSAAAVTAAKNNLPIAHVEAGLREWNKTIPEEINKLLTDAVTDLYFCPTLTGVKNLKNANITKNVFLTGDIGLDLLVNNKEKIADNRQILDKLGIKPNDYFFFTCHRASNTDNPERLKAILDIFKVIEKPVIFPIHPRTKARIEQFGFTHLLQMPIVKVVEPLGFWDTQTLIHFAEKVLTDSGGIVKEAYFHKTPCIIMDNQIEWVEAVEEGWCSLTGANTEQILNKLRHFDTPSVQSAFLGDGTAAKKIVEAIMGFLKAKV
jgi:UDP-GlcNAc3NAcA epimerase